MSFDRLRESVEDLDAWILVLDTEGVNVWCSAGKKTFSTDELVERVHTSGIEKIVSHRKLILPQLSAPGISAHEVKRLSGFEVIYGPIRASDLMSFIHTGYKATREMRRKTFTLKERLVLIPVELTAAGKWFFLISLGLFLLGGLRGLSWSWTEALNHGLFAVLAVFSALFAGAVLTPILLPWLPGRAFSLKGMAIGFLAALLLGVLRIQGAGFLSSYLEALSWIFLVPSISAYLAMNFTGASTYTSLSGVKKEMKRAVPLEIVGGALGLCLWVSSLVMA
jgi:acetyl-CoA decarbonylase/synthase complex subunit gamma